MKLAVARVFGGNENSRQWDDFALVAVIALYVALTVFGIMHLFEFMGADFMAYWSAGYIANHETFVKIYDFSALERTQHLMLFGEFRPNVYFPSLPMAYLPVFVLPFRLLALLPPKVSFWVWTLLNFSLGVGYLVFLAGRYHHPYKKYFLFLFVLSFPFYQTLFWGQVNIWLLVFAGEFLRSLQKGSEFRAGLWLSALLLKPQTLLVMVPALVAARRFKALLGFAIGAGALGFASFAVAGQEGFRGLMHLWLDYSHNLATSGVQGMTNWRMVAKILDHNLPSPIWGYLAIGLSLLTIAWGIFLWMRLHNTHVALAVLAVFSATMLATWHAHAHMAVILIPSLLLLLLRNEFPQRLFRLWLFLPPALYLLGLMALVFIQNRFYAGILYGVAQFVLNLVLLVWVTRKTLGFEE